MHITGKIKVIFDQQSFDSGFYKQEFVVTTEEQYPQDIKIEALKDKCDLLKGFSVGDYVNAYFNLRGNEYNGKYFNSLTLWKLEEVKQEQPLPERKGDEDDLPF